MKTDNKKIDLFYELADRACMIGYETGDDYLSALLKVGEILTGKREAEPGGETEEIFRTLSENTFSREEVRLACELLLVKGFKSMNIIPDFMTPDAVSYLFAMIVKAIADHCLTPKNKLTIMDTMLGSGCMLHTVINHLDSDCLEVNGIGIEKDPLMVGIAGMIADLLGNNLIIDYDDANKDIIGCADIIIGDFGETKDGYNIFRKRLDNLRERGFFVYLLNNDFLSKASTDFREEINQEATLIALIVLPDSFTARRHTGKSILIGRKVVRENYRLAIMRIADPLTPEKAEILKERLNAMFIEIGGKKMSKIMAVNAGSSSLKFQLLEMPAEQLIVSGLVERIKTDKGHFVFKAGGEKIIDRSMPIKNHAQAVQLVLEGLLEKKFVSALTEIKGVGHRVVQGGPYFEDSCLVTEDVKRKIRELIDLAPLHNGPHLVGIEAFEKALPDVPNVVVFDTSFHQTMPEEAFLYGTPYRWYTDYKVRKYGAHGTSHKYVAGEVAEEMGKPLIDLKVITCHLGNGASLAAVKNGKCLDTSMGLTPLDGFPMGTRSGSLDPTVLSYMADKTGLSLREIIRILNNESGYLGISGYSHDSRDLDEAIAAAKKRDATPEEKELGRRCQLALDLQYKRIADYIGSYYVYMGGVDVIVFTAGIGENSPYCREQICKRIAVLGVKIDDDLNYSPAVRGKRVRLSTTDSKIAVYVIPTNEELVIARDVMRLTHF